MFTPVSTKLACNFFLLARITNYLKNAIFYFITVILRPKFAKNLRKIGSESRKLEEDTCAVHFSIMFTFGDNLNASEGGHRTYQSLTLTFGTFYP